MEQVKTELRALNLINRKRKRTEQQTLSEIVNQKKRALAPPKNCPATLAKPYGKCGRTTTPLLSAEWELTNACGVVQWNTSMLPVPED